MTGPSLRRWHEVALRLTETARRSDVMVSAAALTCYAAFGMMPLLAIGVRVATCCFGPADVANTAAGLARFVPGPLHLDTQLETFVNSAARTPWWTVAAAVLPVSLYAEGTVRSLQKFSRAPERKSRTVRGRMLTPVFIVAATLAVVVTVGLLRPLLHGPFGNGLGARLLGILVGFNIVFVGVFLSLLAIYRLFTSTRLRIGPLLVASFVAASWISGQTLGYTLALRLISGFKNAFERLRTGRGGCCAHLLSVSAPSGLHARLPPGPGPARVPGARLTSDRERRSAGSQHARKPTARMGRAVHEEHAASA